MSASNVAAFDLQISEEDASQEDIDRMTRQLLSELRELDVESVDLAHAGPAPAGTKAVDPVTVGTIAMTVLPVVLPKVVDFVQAWAMRGNGRTIKFKGKIGANDIDFEGSPDDLQKLLATLQGGQAQ